MLRPQDDRPGVDMATAAASGTVEPIAAAPLASHGHHGDLGNLFLAKTSDKGSAVELRSVCWF